MTPITTVFAGTPDFALPSLQTLIDHPALDVRAVYTQPDRPAGRGRKLRASPVKTLALASGVEVRQPENFRDEASRAAFAALDPQLFVVAAYGLILPSAILDLSPHPLNVHASLLPRWRGAAPIQRAILAGDTQSGISIMRVVPELDAGPVWVQRECSIERDETGGTLHDKLATLGAEALHEAIECLLRDEIAETPQDEAAVTYAAKITSADRAIDWHEDATAITRRIRALHPVPGARAELAGLDMKILSASASDDTADAAPGSIVEPFRDSVRVACGSGLVCIHELQLAGRKPMRADAFFNGYGDIL